MLTTFLAGLALIFAVIAFVAVHYSQQAVNAASALAAENKSLKQSNLDLEEQVFAFKADQEVFDAFQKEAG